MCAYVRGDGDGGGGGGGVRGGGAVGIKLLTFINVVYLCKYGFNVGGDVIPRVTADWCPMMSPSRDALRQAI